MMVNVGWRNAARRYRFPLFIAVAVVSGTLVLVALNQRAPPWRRGSPALPGEHVAHQRTADALTFRFRNRAGDEPPGR